jgi:DNA-binding transcriptional ArsR family regulator
MSDTQETASPEDFRELTELHDMASHACELLKAMANEWRLIILCQLSEGEKTLSQHLAVLRREKIVSARKDAQSVFYSLAGDEATKVMETLHDLFCGARAAKD